jgi:hypothetical protein
VVVPRHKRPNGKTNPKAKENCDIAIAHYIIDKQHLFYEAEDFLSQESFLQPNLPTALTNHLEETRKEVLSLMPHICSIIRMSYVNS